GRAAGEVSGRARGEPVRDLAPATAGDHGARGRARSRPRAGVEPLPGGHPRRAVPPLAAARSGGRAPWRGGRPALAGNAAEPAAVARALTLALRVSVAFVPGPVLPTAFWTSRPAHGPRRAATPAGEPVAKGEREG